MPRHSPAALIALLTLAGAAFGQSTSHPPAKTAPGRVQPVPKPVTATPPGSPAATPSGTKVADPSAVEFAEGTYRLDSAGLSMLLPLGSTAQSASAGSKSAAQIQGRDKTWLINIQTPRSADPATTTAEVCDRIVTEYLKAAGEIYDRTVPDQPAAVKGLILEPRKQVNVDKQTADRVYFSVPGAGPKDPTIVRGLTVIKNAANQFLIFELVTTPDVFERSKAIYETTVQTAHIEDPTNLNTERAAAIAAGQKVLQSLGPNALQEVVNSNAERWERRFKPAASGLDADATELGYRRIKASAGTRAMLESGGKNPAGAGNHQQGLVVEMDARVLEGGYTIDSKSAFFLAPDPAIDRAEEAWTVRNAIRKDGRTDVVTEIGARTGKSMVVNLEGTGMPQKTIKPVFQGEGYISRVESWLLPQLLLKAGATADFAFYTYQDRAGGICLRRDSLSQPVDKPGLWVLTSKLSDDQQSQVSYFNNKGELIRTELADGSVWEPTTIEKLKQLWESKHLPMK
jgi:hypothetical protein